MRPMGANPLGAIINSINVLKRASDARSSETRSDDGLQLFDSTPCCTGTT